MSDSFFLSVGEASGDILAAELVQELQLAAPNLSGFGIAGPKLRELDFEELAGIEQLSVMGFTEVIKHLSFLKRLEEFLLLEIHKRKPKFAILVDYPGFNMRMAEFLQAQGITVIQYVAPQLWAWGANRTKRLKDVANLVLGIMPFEEQFFLDRGVSYKYVGTPQVDRALNAKNDPHSFLIEEKPVIGFFCGSRSNEVRKILPIVKQVRDIIRLEHPNLFDFAISIAPNRSTSEFKEVMSRDYGELEVGCTVRDKDTLFVKGRSLDLMSSVSSALVTSGTATLECAMVKTPLCVVYKMSSLSFAIAKRLVKLPHVSLVNLVAQQELIREFVQDFEMKELAEELVALATPSSRHSDVTNKLKTLETKLQGNLAKRASHEILQFIQYTPLAGDKI